MTLQEAIAKALLKAMQEDYRIGGSKRSNDANYLAEAVLGVLRADDDTRYVAITRNYWHRLDAISDRLEADGWRLMAQDIRLLVAAYDAVAPNAKPNLYATEDDDGRPLMGDWS